MFGEKLSDLGPRRTRGCPVDAIARAVSEMFSPNAAANRLRPVRLALVQKEMTVSRPSPYSGKVLLVEDDQEVSRSTASLLEQNGFEVALFFNGKDLVQRVRHYDPAITILDLQAVNFDRLRACRELRAFSAMPILMLSGSKDYRSQVLALDSGVDDYMVKPVRPLVLLARIRALLRRPNRVEHQPDRALL